MKIRIISFCHTLFVFVSLYAQPVRLKLPLQINTTNFNHYAPSISADGLTMLFASDYYVTDINTSYSKLTYNKGGDNWSSPEEITSINKSDLQNLYGAHCLSADAKTIYFTSKKMGGVGGQDIWMTEKKGSVWAAPQNLGKPVNSEGMDGFPSLSADGKYLYFIRCQTATNWQGEGCKLYVAEHKGQGIFKEPVELPANINASSVLAPRIAKDGKTLLFSTKGLHGKGGYDLYISRKNGEQWSDPLNLDFLNTPDDEIYGDFTSQGDALIYASPTNGFLTLYKAKVPDKFQPSRILLITGKAANAQKQTLAGFLQISDNQTGQPISINRIDADGKFAAVLPVGKSYDVAITSGNDNFFWSTTFDMTNQTKSKKEDIEAVLPSIEKGTLYHGNKPLFDSTTFQLLPSAALECKRFAKLLQAHADWKTEITLFPSGISNNPPSAPETAYEKMKTALQQELAKTGITPEKVTFVNGHATTDEENNYSGWGWKRVE